MVPVHKAVIGRCAVLFKVEFPLFRFVWVSLVSFRQGLVLIPRYAPPQLVRHGKCLLLLVPRPASGQGRPIPSLPLGCTGGPPASRGSVGLEAPPPPPPLHPRQPRPRRPPAPPPAKLGSRWRTLTSRSSVGLELQPGHRCVPVPAMPRLAPARPAPLASRPPSGDFGPPVAFFGLVAASGSRSTARPIALFWLLWSSRNLLVTGFIRTSCRSHQDSVVPGVRRIGPHGLSPSVCNRSKPPGSVRGRSFVTCFLI